MYTYRGLLYTVRDVVGSGISQRLCEEVSPADHRKGR